MVAHDLTVVRDLGELPPTTEGQQGSSSNLFVPSDDPLLLQLLVTTASSFSIALGASAFVGGWMCMCVYIFQSHIQPPSTPPNHTNRINPNQ